MTIRLRRIDPDVGYYDPTRPPPPLDTSAEPPKMTLTSLQRSKRVHPSQSDSGLVVATNNLLNYTGSVSNGTGVFVTNFHLETEVIAVFLARGYTAEAPVPGVCNRTSGKGFNFNPVVNIEYGENIVQSKIQCSSEVFE